MSWASSIHDDREQGGYFVQRPRRTDAIGKALRSTFDHLPSVPDEMGRLLDRLDGGARHQRYR